MNHTLLVLVLVFLWSPGLQSQDVTAPGEFKLVKGASRCDGMLEMKKISDIWKPVCWRHSNLRLANKVCKELDCGSALSIGQRQNVAVRVWEIILSSDGSQFAPAWFCPQALEVKCSESVRLVDGSNLCSGRLEVRSKQYWSSVCEEHFDLHDAQVVCKELRCGAPSILQGAHYGEAKAPLWKTFQCEGHESALLDCGSSVSNTCSSGKVVKLICSEPYDARLVSGASRCDGEVQVKYLGVWTYMAHFYDSWTLKAADVICRRADCGSAQSVKKTLRQSNWYFTSNCVETTSTFKDCITTNENMHVHKFRVLELLCTGSIRLVQGANLCSGRLEVRYNQSSWSPVCEEHFDLHDAQVVCKELGCVALSVLRGALYGDIQAPLWKTFQCEGHESALLDCGSKVSDICSSGKVVELFCSDPMDVRLVGGASRCDGAVQVKHLEEWRHLESFFNFWTVNASDVICRQLNCGSAVSVSGEHHSQYPPVWDIDPVCVQSTSSLRSCMTGYDRKMMVTLSITCSDSVRLVSGSSLCSGRLEVQSNRSWYSVCEEHFDLRDAQVVCRELGCGAPLVLQGALYGQGEVLPWTSEFQCEGNESALMDCERFSSAEKNCSHGKATGLTCADPVRLVGQSNRCAGTLEVKHQEEWRPVLEHAAGKDLEFGSVCQNLNCGSTVSLKRRQDLPARPVWRVLVLCLNLTSRVKDCTGVHLFYNATRGVDAICSDLLTQPIISLSDGVSEAYLQGFRFLMGSNFTIRCSIEPQSPKGFFRLISTTSKPQNLTLPAVNHSAHFLFTAAGYIHQGSYICIYHGNVFNHSFSSQSRALYLFVGASTTELVLKALIIFSFLLVFDAALFIYYKVSMRQIRLEAEHSRTSRRRRSNRTTRMTF